MMVKEMLVNKDTSGVERGVKKRKRKKFAEKYSRWFLIASIILLILVIILLALFIDRDKKVTSLTQNQQKDNERKKFSPATVQVASDIISAMDMTVDPCEDFYQYSCGGWLKKTTIPEGRFLYNNMYKINDRNTISVYKILKDLKTTVNQTKLLRRASIFYESCMNVSAIDAVGDLPLRELIQELGSWPVADPNFNSSNWNFVKVLAAYHKNMNAGFLFHVSVSADLKNSSRNVITFTQAGSATTESSTESSEESSMLEMIEDEDQDEKKKSATLKWMSDTAKELGANDSTITVMEEVWEFEQKLKKLKLSALQFKMRLKESYEKMNLTEFSKKTEIPLDWLVDFLSTLFEDTGYRIEENEMIVSFSTSYIKSSYKMFTALNTDVQSSHVIWSAIKSMIPYLSGNYRTYYNNYQAALIDASLISPPPPRWKTCVASTSRIYRFVLSKLFVKKVFDKSTRTEISEMVRSIKEVFEKNLDSIDWMDETTRQYAKKKVSTMRDLIGYPDYIFNDTIMEEMYGSFIPKPGHYYRNCIETQRFLSHKTLTKVGTQVDDFIWRIAPFTVNAVHDYLRNNIVFPAGILQAPFYDKRAPKAINYGAIGMIVAHEILHGFDTTGKDFGINGNLNPWWTSKSLQKLKEKSQCFVKQYKNYELFSYQVNGNVTLGENLADNGALKQSFQAYKNWVNLNGEEEHLPGLDLTPDQLYFLAFAQTWCTAYTEFGAIIQLYTDNHSPNIFRVKGSIQNSEEFKKAFKCPAGSTMNPVSKCQVW